MLRQPRVHTAADSSGSFKLNIYIVDLDLETAYDNNKSKDSKQKSII